MQTCIEAIQAYLNTPENRPGGFPVRARKDRLLPKRPLSSYVLTGGLVGLLLLSPTTLADPIAPPENTSQPEAPLQSTGASKHIPKPSFVTLTLNKSISEDTEIIQWPDGGLSIPIKTFAALYNIAVQQSEEEKRFFFIDPLTQKQVDLYWESQHIKVDDVDIPIGKHPLVKNIGGLLIQDDVYVDQAVAEHLLDTTFTFDNDTTTLNLSTTRKLKASITSSLSDNLAIDDTNVQLIRNPEIVRHLIEKVHIQNTSTYNYQAMQQPSGPGNRLRNDYLYMLLDNPMVGISGSLLGQDYYIKPSFVRYNGKANFQDVDWSIQHPFKNSTLSLGSTDAGLSPLTSPTLRIWALKFASQNAATPFLTPRSNYEFSGKAAAGSQVSLHINNRVLQTITSKDGTYEFEPVYLQPQAINQISIVSKDAENRETTLLEKEVANYHNMLPKGEKAYSTFMGRVPLQFYPLIPDQKTPMLLPQSEKWFAGGRLFYGVSNRLTVGLTTAADNIFGKPETYFTFLNPFSVDLTGFSSYQRDPNFTRGENVSLSMRYQLRDHWLASLDTGFSHFDLRSGTLLRNPDTNLGKAAQFHLERQGRALSWFFDAFRYDPYYYTPTTLLFGNNLYDKQGIGTGINGSFNKLLNVNYNLKWNRYKTNLEQLIPGGYINADHWNGTINGRINDKNSFGVTVNWINGTNREREFIQRSLDLGLYTQSLPWGMMGEIKASHYFTNTLFFPSRSLGTDLVESEYHNNILNTALKIPLGKVQDTHIKIGHQLSTFVDFAFIQGSFRFKNLFLEPAFQKSYGQKQQTQDRIGARMGYQFPNGARFSISYFKNTNTFSTLLDSVPPSKIKTDQFYMDFSDIIGFLGKRPRSLGPNADTIGIISGTVFADYSADGKLDKTEPGIKNIKLMIDKQQLVVTDEKGHYTLTGLNNGYHTIEILGDSLPLTLSMDNPIYKVKIQEGKIHRVNICLTPQGGSMRGSITLTNISGQAVTSKGVILVLKSPQGKTINYTSADESGHYQFSNIPAGQYLLDLEQTLKENGRYKILEAPNLVEIAKPKHYEETTDIKNLNFKLLAL